MPVLPVFIVTSEMREVRVDLVADTQGLEEFQLAAGPHPARQRHRWQEAAAGGVAVGPQLRHRVNRRRQAPMHGERRGVARLRLADIHEQRGAQALHQLRGDDVGGFVAAADPLAQMIQIELLVHDDLIRVREGLAVLMLSPMAGTRAIAARLIDEDGRRRGIAHRPRRGFDLDAAQMRMHGQTQPWC